MSKLNIELSECRVLPVNAHPFWKKYEMRAPAQTVKCGLTGALYVCRKKSLGFAKLAKKCQTK